MKERIDKIEKGEEKVLPKPHSAWPYSLGIFVLLALAVWSGWTLHFQADLFSLFPQHLDSLKDLRKLQNTSGTHDVYVVLHPECSWEELVKERFWESLESSLNKESSIQEVYRGLKPDESAKVKWLASKLASLPEDQFSSMVERLSPPQVAERFEEIPQLLAGAFDPEELYRIRMDPFNVLGELGFDQSKESSWSEGNLQKDFLSITPKELPKSFEDCRSLEMTVQGAIDDALRELNLSHDADFVYLTGEPIFTAEISTHMRKDIIVMVIFTFTLVLFAFWVVYRSLNPLVWIGLTQIMAASSALIAARWLIGEVNVLSIGFASILMGISIDYSILVYHHFAGGQVYGNKRWRLLVKGIWFSALTTSLAFGILYFSSFPGLKQLAVLVAVGLIGSATFATTFLAWLLSRRPPHSPPNLHRIADRWGSFLEANKGKALVGSISVLVMGLVVCLMFEPKSWYTADVKKLEPSNLRVYEGHALFKSMLPQSKADSSVREENRELWVSGRQEALLKAADVAGFRAEYLETTLQVVHVFDQWVAGSLTLSNKSPGAAEWKQLREDLDHAASDDFKRLTFLALGLMTGICWFAHRSIRLVVLNFFSLVITIVLLLVCLKIFNLTLTIVSLLCVPLLIGVVLDYTMHMLIGLEHEKGNLRQSFRHLLVPIGLTGIASVIGFTAPALSSQPALANFGLVMDIGIICAIVTALFILPLFHRYTYVLVKEKGSHYSQSLYRAEFFEIASRLVAMCPRRLIRFLAQSAGKWYARLYPTKTGVVRENLSLLNHQDVSLHDVRNVYGNFGAVLSDYFYLGTRSRKEALKLLKKRVGYEHLQKAHSYGKGILLITPHLSLFELGGVLMSELEFPSVVLTIPEPTTELTEWRSDFRKRWGVETLEVGNDVFSSLPIIKCLEQNKTVIALIDRSYTSYPISVSLPNGEVLFAGGVLLLALIAKCPIVVATIHQDGEGFYRAKVQEPFFVEPKGSREETLKFYGQKIADILLPTLQENRTEWFQFVPIKKDEDN